MPSSLNFQVARTSSDFEAREVLEDAKKVSNEAQAKNISDRIGKICLKVGRKWLMLKMRFYHNINQGNTRSEKSCR